MKALFIFIGLLATPALAQLNPSLFTRGASGTDYSDVAQCIGKMGVAKMQALEIKLQQTKNDVQTRCMLRDKTVDSYAKRNVEIIREDPTVFELEKCNQNKADAFRAMVDDVYQADQPACK